MAMTKITPAAKMRLNTLSEPVTFEAAAVAEDGFSVPYAAQDGKLVLLAKNDGSAEATLTIKRGNGIMGAADTEAFSMGAGELRAIVLESMAFKNVYGTDKGCVAAIPSATDVKLAAIQLP